LPRKPDDGLFHLTKPLDSLRSEGEVGHLFVEDLASLPEPLALALEAFGGMTPNEIDEIEAIALDRRPFFMA
jgi:hypothetical protein